MELDEIKIGCLSLLTSGTLSALVITYIANGGPCMVYWTMDEYTWAWWFLQWPVIFLYQVSVYFYNGNCTCSTQHVFENSMYLPTVQGSKVLVQDSHWYLTEMYNIG